MIRRNIPVVVVAAAIWLQASGGKAMPLGSIKLEVTGISSVSGTLIVTLHQNQKGLDGAARPVRMKRVDVTAEHMRIGFDGLVPGYYAIAVFQDLNGNGWLDHTAEGVAAEPAGFSRNATGRGGTPEFRDAAILIDGPDIPHRIRLVGPPHRR